MKKVCTDCKCFTVKEEQAYCTKFNFFLLLNCGCGEIELKHKKFCENQTDEGLCNIKIDDDNSETWRCDNCFEEF